MQNYLTVAELWDVTGILDIPLADMTQAQRRRNNLAHICLTDNLSMMYAEMVGHMSRAYDVWSHLQQVRRVCAMEWSIGSVPRNLLHTLRLCM